MVNKKDYIRHKEFIKPNFGPLTFLIMAIIKFFFYQIPIIPLNLYAKSKRLLFKRRLHIVKQEVSK